MTLSTETARLNMIQQQIRPWDVVDERVLETLTEIPREDFVPDAYRNLAYADIEVPMAHGETMLAPKIVAKMLQALNVQPGDRVLEIGTGTGYVTACLARLGGEVLSLELHPDLVDQARAHLAQLQLRNVVTRTGDGLASPIDGGPFDIIAVTGSVPTPTPLDDLTDQLQQGGRLFAIVGEDPVMEAVLITRIDQTNLRRVVQFETSAPSLANVPQPERFAF